MGEPAAVTQADGAGLTECAVCGDAFAPGKLMRRQAEGFDSCVGCVIDHGREPDLSENDASDLAERRWADRSGE